MSKSYIIIIAILTFIVPAVATVVEYYGCLDAIDFAVFVKWVVFSAIGVRMSMTGILQLAKPDIILVEPLKNESEYTPLFMYNQYKEKGEAVLFMINRSNAYKIGFANILLGMVSFLLLFMPELLTFNVIFNGIYYGLCELLPIYKKPAGVNKQFIALTNLFIFGILAIYLITVI